MRHELWRTILTARADIDKLVAAAVGDYPEQGPPRMPTAWSSAATSATVVRGQGPTRVARSVGGGGGGGGGGCGLGGGTAAGLLLGGLFLLHGPGFRRRRLARPS